MIRSDVVCRFRAINSSSKCSCLFPVSIISRVVEISCRVVCMNCKILPARLTALKGSMPRCCAYWVTSARNLVLVDIMDSRAGGQNYLRSAGVGTHNYSSVVGE
jgi:hypothetical protein